MNDCAGLVRIAAVAASCIRNMAVNVCVDGRVEYVEAMEYRRSQNGQRGGTTLALLLRPWNLHLKNDGKTMAYNLEEASRSIFEIMKSVTFVKMSRYVTMTNESPAVGQRL